jgi:hypothetical protein
MGTTGREKSPRDPSQSGRLLAGLVCGFRAELPVLAKLVDIRNAFPRSTEVNNRQNDALCKSAICYQYA